MKHKIVCINLPRRIDRRERMEQIFSDHNITNYEYFDAIDGKELIMTEEIFKLFLFNDFKYRCGVVGCALSHYNIMKKLLNDNDYDAYIVFEDDISIAPKFNENIQRTFDSLDLFGDDFYICFLGSGGSDRTKIGEDVMIESYNGTSGMFGYIITKKLAMIIVPAIEKHGMKYAIDNYMQKFCTYEGIPMHITVPPLVTAEIANANSEIDTDIQRAYDPVKNTSDFIYVMKEFMLEGYKFIPNVDFCDNDILQLKTDDIHQMKKLCDKMHKCVGFNTNGYFKETLGKMTNTTYSNYKINGFYLKQSAVQK